MHLFVIDPICLLPWVPSCSGHTYQSLGRGTPEPMQLRPERDSGLECASERKKVAGGEDLGLAGLCVKRGL